MIIGKPALQKIIRDSVAEKYQENYLETICDWDSSSIVVVYKDGDKEKGSRTNLYDVIDTMIDDLQRIKSDMAPHVPNNQFEGGWKWDKK